MIGGAFWLGAGILGVIITKRPGAAFFALILAGLVSPLLNDWFDLEVLQIISFAGAGMELVFLLNKYRKYTWWIVIVSSLMGAVGLAIGVEMFYSGGWDALGEYAWQALTAGVLARVLGKVLKKV